MAIDVDSGLLWLAPAVVCVLLAVAIYDMNEGEDNDDDGMDEER